ncbi:hypothetical protein [Deinococcus enclensis]|uniref:Uncharacterized protein n=1 Tax=Deinococcus enclensis TaxID=1049582 RepID=A0ABT9MF68_9DEIO|nr:hypothetical protein [Deinococcus enclensis]MDP9765129.1 hypothetical protein [Deinococcus enclensis]
MRPVLTAFLACGLLAQGSALPVTEKRVRLGYFAPLVSSTYMGATTPLEIVYDVRPTGGRSMPLLLTLTLHPEGSGPVIQRTASLPATGWGGWKGEVPIGRLEIRATGRGCVSTQTVTITRSRKIVRATYVFNGLHTIHSELFVAGKRVSYGTCG